jgi:anti-sigma regulatory factor (Ser/Thr protein kinase)
MAIISTTSAINEPSDVSAARRAAERLAQRADFDETRTGQVALVVTELATNIIKHAGHGAILITPCYTDTERGIEVLAIDSSHGFSSVQDSMVDGRSTAGSLGNGLGAVRRLSDTFEIFSQPSKGTVAMSRLWSRPPAAAESEFALGALNVAKAGEDTSGDTWYAKVGRHYAAVIVADGLGHGLLAAEASAAAVDAFQRDPHRSPSLTLEDVHRSLRATRGAAVAIATIEFGRDIALFAGLGNIIASIVVDDKRRNLVSHNGIAGHNAHRFQEFSYPMPRNASMVLHSDGLGSHWDPRDYPGLWVRDPSLVAGVLYRDFTRNRDDVTIVVGRRGR